MNEKQEWKRLQLWEKNSDWRKGSNAKDYMPSESDCEEHASRYLIARDEQQEERRKELLYRVLGPVFFGRKEAESWQELRELFQRRYGIDVDSDFFEGDEHYEEYVEAQQAIAEGMAIYSGSISFDEETLAEYAEQLWDDLEQMDQKRFRRINTMLEE